MLNQLIHHLGKGNISSKVGYYALQGTGASTVIDFGTVREGADAFVVVSVLRLFYADFSKRAVPLEFFYPRAKYGSVGLRFPLP